MNNMPSMPKVNDNSLPVEDIEKNEELHLPQSNSPSQEEIFPKQEYVGGEKDIATNVKMPLAPKSGIEVVATRKGFYGQRRINEGDEFRVKKFEDLGQWMKCKDKDLERQRVKFFKDKKAKK